MCSALQAPQFATDARIRGTHCKSHEELEAEEMATMPHFKARAIKFVSLLCCQSFVAKAVLAVYYNKEVNATSCHSCEKSVCHGRLLQLVGIGNSCDMDNSVNILPQPSLLRNWSNLNNHGGVAA